MTNENNDSFTITNNNLNMHYDFRAIVSPESVEMKTPNLYYFTTPYNETGSFIVDWQMSTDDD